MKTIWVLMTVGYVDENESITEPKFVTHHPEQKEIRAFASKHGYHNEDYMMIEAEVIRDDYWGFEFETIENSEIYF